MSFKYEYTKSCYQNAENIFNYSLGTGEAVIEDLSFSCQLLHILRLQKVLKASSPIKTWQLPSLHIRWFWYFQTFVLQLVIEICILQDTPMRYMTIGTKIEVNELIIWICYSYEYLTIVTFIVKEVWTSSGWWNYRNMLSIHSTETIWEVAFHFKAFGNSFPASFACWKLQNIRIFVYSYRQTLVSVIITYKVVQIWPGLICV